MAAHFEIDDSFIAAQNQKAREWVEEDYEHLGKKLRRQNVDIEALCSKAQQFRVAVPSWGVGTGGTRFARFPNIGEPRNIFEKLEDKNAGNLVVPAGKSVTFRYRFYVHEGDEKAAKVAERYAEFAK